MPTTAGPFEPGRAHQYSSAERLDQIQRFVDACERVSKSFAEGHWPGAEEYAQVAAAAASCLPNPLDHEHLKAVATSLPPEPSWMDPRMPDYNGPRQPWQETATAARAEANRAALEMRAFATYDRP
jgi:hypothetical protein